MATYYYFNGATGNNDGTSEANAWTSLVTAMTGLTAGSTLYLKAATGGVRHDVTEDSFGYVYYTLSGTEDEPKSLLMASTPSSFNLSSISR